MRLEVGAVREMHWHLSAEWAYVLKGDLRVSTVTADGDVWLDDVVRFFIFIFQVELSFINLLLSTFSRLATSGTSPLANHTPSKRKTPPLKEQSFSSSSITGHSLRTLHSCLPTGLRMFLRKWSRRILDCQGTCRRSTGFRSMSCISFLVRTKSAF